MCCVAFMLNVIINVPRPPSLSATMVMRRVTVPSELSELRCARMTRHILISCWRTFVFFWNWSFTGISYFEKELQRRSCWWQHYKAPHAGRCLFRRSCLLLCPSPCPCPCPCHGPYTYPRLWHLPLTFALSLSLSRPCSCPYPCLVSSVPVLCLPWHACRLCLSWRLSWPRFKRQKLFVKERREIVARVTNRMVWAPLSRRLSCIVIVIAIVLSFGLSCDFHGLVMCTVLWFVFMVVFLIVVVANHGCLPCCCCCQSSWKAHHKDEYEVRKIWVGPKDARLGVLSCHTLHLPSRLQWCGKRYCKGRPVRIRYFKRKGISDIMHVCGGPMCGCMCTARCVFDRSDAENTVELPLSQWRSCHVVVLPCRVLSRLVWWYCLLFWCSSLVFVLVLSCLALSCLVIVLYWSILVFLSSTPLSRLYVFCVFLYEHCMKEWCLWHTLWQQGSLWLCPFSMSWFYLFDGMGCIWKESARMEDRRII